MRPLRPPVKRAAKRCWHTQTRKRLCYIGVSLGQQQLVQSRTFCSGGVNHRFAHLPYLDGLRAVAVALVCWCIFPSFRGRPYRRDSGASAKQRAPVISASICFFVQRLPNHSYTSSGKDAERHHRPKEFLYKAGTAHLAHLLYQLGRRYGLFPSIAPARLESCNLYLQLLPPASSGAQCPRTYLVVVCRRTVLSLMAVLDCAPAAKSLAWPSPAIVYRR